MIASITVTRILIQKLEEQIQRFLKGISITTSMVVYDQSPAFKLVNNSNGAVALVKFEEASGQQVGVGALFLTTDTYNKPAPADRVKTWIIDLNKTAHMSINKACVFTILYLGSGVMPDHEKIDVALMGALSDQDNSFGYPVAHLQKESSIAQSEATDYTVGQELVLNPKYKYSWSGFGCDIHATFTVLEIRQDNKFGSGVGLRVSPAVQPNYPYDPLGVFYDSTHFVKKEWL